YDGATGGIFGMFITVNIVPYITAYSTANLALLQTVKDSLKRDQSFTHPGNSVYAAGQTVQLYHLKEGIERFFITDINNPAGSAVAQSTLAMMWDVVGTDVSIFNHVPGGANVLFADGHVEFQKYVANGDATQANFGANGEDDQFPTSTTWAWLTTAGQ
ncbi:MAG: hypothetical protein JNK74_29325, partial [Candidatus Hydrogenedentes bacterium]|nr:hypothetical protein [Candidatus Hydrogenedentota bacterium]